MPQPAPPRPAPPAPAPTRLPGSAAAPVRTATVQPKGANSQTDDLAPGILELKGLPAFTPTAPIADFLDARKTSSVNVRFGKLAQGPVTVATRGKGKYHLQRQPVPLAHPMFARVAEYAPGLTPSLVFTGDEKKLTGEVGLAAGEKIEGLKTHLARSPELLGLVGFSIPALPTLINAVEGGSLHVGMKGVPIRLGAAFQGTFNFEAIDEAITFDGNAAIQVMGLANGTLDLKRAQDGLITGKTAVGLNLPKNISGNVDVAWDGQVITGEGKVGYQGEKLSGNVTLHLMEKGQAEQLEAAKKAPEGAPAPAAPARKGQPSRIDYAVFGEGDLNFAFTEWLNGNAHVIVDPKGFLTIIGKITPQKEFILFEQKDYNKQLFKVEARASYGIPVVGNIFIFANVSMEAFANLGPAKFYNIIIEGTYSTDPQKSKDFSIRGSLNMSAAAGLKLRGEAGAGLTILAHDIKAGAGINGIAGIKGYAEATPIIGYREKAAPGQDKKGEFYIRGELEIAAQPFLGLSGDLFVEIDAPWWSPVPDKKWTWPLFNKEWPIGGSLGIGASVDYVFGSGQFPKLDFKPVEFSADKFMSDMYADKAKSGSGKEVEQKGKWQEKNSPTADVPPKTSPKGNAARGKLPASPSAKSKVQPGGGKKGDRSVDPNARTKEGKTVKQLQDEAVKKGKKPEGQDVKGVKSEAAKKDKSQETHDEELKKGLAALDAVTAAYAKNGATKEEVIGGVKSVRRKFKVFKSIEVVDGGETWDYSYTASLGTNKTGAKKAKKEISQKVLEGLVSRQDPIYDPDSLGRAKGPYGHIIRIKQNEKRESLPIKADLPGGEAAYRPGDHRGHLIGDRFCGKPANENLVPMHRVLNLSTFKTFENAAAQKYLDLESNKKPVLLYMKIVPKYPKDDKNDPSSYRPEYVIPTATIISLKEKDGKVIADPEKIPGSGTKMDNPK